MKSSSQAAPRAIKLPRAQTHKNLYAHLLVASLIGLKVVAQIDSTTDISTPAVQPVDVAQQVGPPGDGVYAITEAGPHHRRWAKLSQVQMPDGSFEAVTNSYVELATGLNRLDANKNSWVPADAKFEIVNGAAVATNTAHRVILTSPTDPLPVDVLMPDGQRLSSSVLGISYYSATTGNSVMIAEPRPTQGKLIAPDQVIYEDCFDGGFQADLRYSLSLAGISQDVVLRDQPPPPGDFGFGQTERIYLQVVTEFLNAPVPAIEETTVRSESNPVLRQQMYEPDFTDQFVSFGTMQLWPGKAIDLGAAPETTSPIVVKHWEVIDGRNILFEEVSLAEAGPLLINLPAQPQAALRPNSRRVLATSREALIAALPRVASQRKSVALVQSTIGRPGRQKGLALDWTLLQSATNFTFQGDSTYYATNLVVLSGVTTLEGGAVIKAIPYNTNYDRKIFIGGSLVCQTSPYRMAVLTARDDDSVGEILPDSLHGIPSGTSYIDWLSSSGPSAIALSYVRFCYSILGASLWSSTNYSISHCQFVNCTTGLEIAYGSCALRNVLINNAYHALRAYAGSTISCEHLTVDNASTLNYNYSDPSNQFFLTNCLVTQATTTNAFSGVNNVVLSSSSGVYTPIGAGSYYLAANSSYRNAGTSGISPQLATDFKRKTTYPPLLITNTTISVATTLAPQVQRDTDTPDLGYHYDPLDYVLSAVTVTNATLLLTNGVAIGTFGSNSLNLITGAKFISEGTPTNPNRLGHINRVQEQSLTFGSTNRFWLTSLAPGPEIRLHHSDYSTLAGDANSRYFLQNWEWETPALVEILNSYLRGSYQNVGSYSYTNATFTMGNNFLERPGWTFYQNTNSLALTMNQYNNLVWHGWFDYYFYVTNSAWTVSDNLFQCDYLTSYAQNFTSSHNGYVSGLAVLSGDSAAKTNIVSDYQGGSMTNYLGYLGTFYYPTNGTNLATLINAGSRNATSAGLYHYTTTTNQVKETNTVVDIGFHYVALDGSGNPDDTDNDGIPDYLEDRNGNGSVDSGETDWRNAMDLGLKVWISEPKGNANLP
jgi:hypothetical protein